jgi:hypothetical protein
MTVLRDMPGMNRTSHSGVRLIAFLFAVLFGIQCVWLSAAELIRPDIDQLPTDMTGAATAAKKRVSAGAAAFIGAVRGDLWAQSAYTYAYLLWPESGENSKAPEAAERARENLDRALRWGPPQSGAWLLLAGLGQEFRLPGIAPIEALKMSYYTGPTELALLPLRLRLAVQADKFDDFEIRQFVGRDLRLLLAQDKKSALNEAYRTASPAGRNFMEQAIKDIDPSALSALYTAERKGSLPH